MRECPSGQRGRVEGTPFPKKGVADALWLRILFGSIWTRSVHGKTKGVGNAFAGSNALLVHIPRAEECTGGPDILSPALFFNIGLKNLPALRVCYNILAWQDR
jgi:hypothetical protein